VTKPLSGTELLANCVTCRVEAVINGRRCERTTIVAKEAIRRSRIDLSVHVRDQLFLELVRDARERDGIITSLLLTAFDCPIVPKPKEDSPKAIEQDQLMASLRKNIRENPALQVHKPGDTP